MYIYIYWILQRNLEIWPKLIFDPNNRWTSFKISHFHRLARVLYISMMLLKKCISVAPRNTAGASDASAAAGALPVPAALAGAVPGMSQGSNADVRRQDFLDFFMEGHSVMFIILIYTVSWNCCFLFFIFILNIWYGPYGPYDTRRKVYVWTAQSIIFGRQLFYGPHSPLWTVLQLLFRPYGPFLNSTTAPIWIARSIPSAIQVLHWPYGISELGYSSLKDCPEWISGNLAPWRIAHNQLLE